MAHQNGLAARIESDYQTLYWWRRRVPPRYQRAQPGADCALDPRIHALAAQRRAHIAKPSATATAAAANPIPAAAEPSAIDAVLADALRHERRSTAMTFLVALLATSAPLATMLYALAAAVPIAAALAGMGLIAAGYGLFFAMRRLLVLGMPKVFDRH
jgi:hypothetical protein